MIQLVLTAMVLAVELTLAAAGLLSKVPIHVDMPYVQSIMPSYQRTFQPQRNLLLYALGIAFGIAIFFALRWFVDRCKDKTIPCLKLFLVIHTVCAFLMGHAGFEIVAMNSPVWAWPVFWGSFVLAVAVTVFWPEFLRGIDFLKGCYASIPRKEWLGPLLGCLVIFLIIYMPDLQAAVAMVYMGEYFHDWDVDLFGGVYALSHGLLPDIDVITAYGFGITVIVARIVHLLGGFDYARILGLMMWAGIIYYSLWFLLVRRFLASGLLAFAAILFTIRLQMFNLLLEPFVWAHVMATVFRYCFDIGIFWMLWLHLQTRRIIYLYIGAVFVSLAIFYILTTGMYMFFVFAFYVLLAAFLPCLGGGKDRICWRNHALVIVTVFALTFLWFFMSVGGHIFEKTFQQNMVEYNSFFIRGIFSDRLTVPIARGDLGTGIGGLLLPVFYLGTFLYAAGKVIDGKVQKRDIFAGLLAFYGLGIHSYYIVRASLWYSVGAPGIYLFFFWVAKALESAPLRWRKRFGWGLVLAAIFCLVTNRWFVGYPNYLSLSRNPVVDARTSYKVGPHLIPYFHQLVADFPEGYKLPLNSLGEKDENLKHESDFATDQALKDYYAKETAWPEDTAMIRRLTPKDSRVPIISSFEILFLKDADRKPFFYYFTLINSHPMTFRNFMVTGLLSYPELQNLLEQLDREKPPYIFMERIFLTPQVPQAYFYDFPDLISILRYVLANYEPQEVGKYLVAMKRK